MIKIHKSKNGQYYFTVHAKNGAVLVTSEMYTRKSSVKRVVDKFNNLIFVGFGLNIEDVTLTSK